MHERISRHAAAAVVARVSAAARTLAPHEEASLDAMAADIAALLGADYLGLVATADLRRVRAAYWVPDDTLDAVQARALDIHGPDDLFGGVVPCRFAATKLVSHPLVDADALAPAGWSPGLGARLGNAVLPGYAVFCRDDACRAAEQLLPLGPLRLKLARGVGGHGQALVEDHAGLERALAALPDDELRRHGATLEQDLQDAGTWSIGHAHCGGIRVAYAGVQHSTRNRDGHVVYGGSELDVVRGDFDALLAAPIGEAARCAVRRVQEYDDAMSASFPGFYASRRNYDVVVGRDRRGQETCGVLEQSWRIGGASPAELLAMRAFAADPALQRVRASCHEVHGEFTPPAGATINFRGEDPNLGPMCKYATVA
jgi:hypothetical protein